MTREPRMKRLHTHSQNFLRNPRLVKELIGHTTIKSNDTVYDIGAGSGVISSVLATKCLRVVAIEVEPATVKILRKNVEQYTNVSVLETDFLAMELPATPYKVFANIPFHLSSAIVRKITEDTNPPQATYLIVQKQFAHKLLPDHTGFTSQLGMILGVRFQIKIRKRLRRTDFWPHPNVDTVLLEILYRDEPLVAPRELPAYIEFTEKHFTTPALYASLPLELIQKDTSVKPSSLTLSEWLILFRATR